MGVSNHGAEALSTPYIIFKVKSNHYTVNSKNAYSIMNMPEYTTLPEAPHYIQGIFIFQSEPVLLVNLRTLFGHKTVSEDFKEFADMIEMRKNDHINWAEELERCVETGDKFKLATDPHKCAFGKWYDNFKSDNNYISFHLNKIDEPHQKLHKAAEDAVGCEKKCAECTREECLATVMKKVKREYVPTVIGLLDKSVEVMEHGYKEMVIVMAKDGKKVGFVVDEVLAVEDMPDMGSMNNINKFKNIKYVCGVKKSSKIQEPVLEFNEDELMSVSEGVVV